MNKLHFFLSLFVVTSCASLKTANNCLDDSQVQSLLSKAQSLVDTAARMDGDAVAGQSDLVSDQCWKQIYVRGNYRIVLYRNPNEEVGSVQMVARNIRQLGISHRECLQRAVADSNSLSPIFANILGRYHAEHGWLWNDPDIGPVTWLECGRKRDVAYFESLAGFLHELNHPLKQDQCLFLASAANHLCFRFDKRLPPRSLAKLEDFPTQDPYIRRMLTGVQHNYLNQTDAPFHLLLDELNCYIVSTRVVARVLDKWGKAALFEKGTRQRTMILLPLFLVYAVQYLEKFQEEDSESFAKHFSRGGQNCQALSMLLNDAEAGYLEWLKALERVKEKPEQIEESLWRKYLGMKRQLFHSGC